MKRFFYFCMTVSWGLMVGGCQQSSETTEIPLPVVKTVSLDKEEQAPPGFSLFGRLQAKQTPKQAFQVGGKVLKRLVGVGDSVEKGQLLALIDDKDLQLAVFSARAVMEATQAEARQAEADLKRLKALLTRKLTSEQAVEQAQNRLTVLQKRLQAEAQQLQQSQNQLHYAQLKAPMDGTVSSVSVDVGNVVSAGQVVFSLIPDLGREIRVSVPQKRIKELPNQAQVTIEGKTYDLTLSSKAPQSEAASSWTAFYDFAGGSDLPVKFIGQSYSVHFPSMDSGIKVPISALYEQGDQASIWYLKENIAHRRAVQVMKLDNRFAWVKGDLEGIERIVFLGVHQLNPGQQVKEVRE